MSGRTQPHSPTPPGDTAVSAPIVSSRPSHADPLRGQGERVGEGLLGLATAVLRSPAAVVEDLHRGRPVLTRLSLLVIATMLISGLVAAAFSGGLQWLVVPAKLTLGMFFCAVLCLPSLYVFSSLSGAKVNLRETVAAMLMGIALIGVLLVGLAPVLWLFSQTTASVAVMGALHIGALILACCLGLGLVARVIGAINGSRWPGFANWAVLFVVVVLQMTTTLRPLVGEFTGELIGEKMFFLHHWANVLQGLGG